MSKRGVKGVRGWARVNAPQYHVFFDAKCEKKMGEDGLLHRYYFTVITLIHKEARPVLQPRSIRDAGMSAGDAAFVEGRVLCTALPGRTKGEKGVLGDRRRTTGGNGGKQTGVPTFQ